MEQQTLNKYANFTMKFKDCSTHLLAERPKIEYQPGDSLLLGLLNFFYIFYTNSMEILEKYLTNMH
jgi:hypothetical protein